MTQPTLFDTPITSRPIPTSSWLLDHLIAGGHATETGITRHARIRPCPRCQQLVISGLDADLGAFETDTDPQPLSPLGEALALINGTRTLDLLAEDGRYVLERRRAAHITATPAGTGHHNDVLQQHHCGTPAPTGPLAAPSTFPAATAQQLPAGSPPPF